MTETTQWEKDCYGTSEANIHAEVERAEKEWFTKPPMFVMSILSDAQSVLEFGDAEAARKKMNVAKFVVANYLREKRD